MHLKFYSSNFNEKESTKYKCNSTFQRTGNRQLVRQFETYNKKNKNVNNLSIITVYVNSGKSGKYQTHMRQTLLFRE